jgi:hypothetical protein
MGSCSNLPALLALIELPIEDKAAKAISTSQVMVWRERAPISHIEMLQPGIIATKLIHVVIKPSGTPRAAIPAVPT